MFFMWNFKKSVFWGVLKILVLNKCCSFCFSMVFCDLIPLGFMREPLDAGLTPPQTRFQHDSYLLQQLLLSYLLRNMSCKAHKSWFCAQGPPKDFREPETEIHLACLGRMWSALQWNESYTSPTFLHFWSIFSTLSQKCLQSLLILKNSCLHSEKFCTWKGFFAHLPFETPARMNLFLLVQCEAFFHWAKIKSKLQILSRHSAKKIRPLGNLFEGAGQDI